VPTYQYACTECGHQLEAVQSFSDEQLTVCPECEGRLRKLFNSVGIVFKGTGFYRNDSRANVNADAKPETAAKSDTKADSSSTKSESKTESKSESKTESKSESKSESKTGSKSGDSAKSSSSTAPAAA
jgi:putative FmdB family regulatory protein